MESSFIPIPTRPVEGEPAAVPEWLQGHYKNARIAYEDAALEIAAVRDHELVAVPSNVAWAVVIGLGALPKLRELEPRLVADVADYPADQSKRIERYALAANWADACARGEPATPGIFTCLLGQALAEREGLREVAETFVRLRVVPRRRPLELGRGRTHLEVATDLLELAAFLSWALTNHENARAPIGLCDLDRARTLAGHLMVAIGTRALPSGEPIPEDVLADNRARAYALYHNAYEVCRRAVAYLRASEGDANDIVPSLSTRERKP